MSKDPVLRYVKKSFNGFGLKFKCVFSDVGAIGIVAKKLTFYHREKNENHGGSRVLYWVWISVEGGRVVVTIRDEGEWNNPFIERFELGDPGFDLDDFVVGLVMLYFCRVRD